MNPIDSIIIKELQAYFPADEVEVRVGPTYKDDNGDPSGGKALFYIPARRVQQRLDNVVGPMGWQVSYAQPVNRSESEKYGAEATISIRDPFTGEWVSKSDVSQNTAQEGMKGGYSKALVRAGVQWGIGRYLYFMPDTGWHDVENNYGTTSFAKKPEMPKRFTPEHAGSGSQFTQREVRQLRQAAAGKDRKAVAEVFDDSLPFQELLDAIRNV